MGYRVTTIEIVMSVPSVEETAEWYERVLGWKAEFDTFDEGGRCAFGSVYLPAPEDEGVAEAPFRGFNLSRHGAGAEGYEKGERYFTALVQVDDADAVYERAVGAGAVVDGPPQDQPWRMRTFGMKDLNGFVLMFAQHLGTGSPAG
jgi:uncharacterized glyoxalase superfamily protein PhnB